MNDIATLGKEHLLWLFESACQVWQSEFGKKTSNSLSCFSVWEDRKLSIFVYVLQWIWLVVA